MKALKQLLHKLDYRRAQRLKDREMRAQVSALNKVQAVIEFEPDGTIIGANENFLGAVGYSLEEIKGQHHRLFMPAGEADKPAYTAFWNKLAQGQFDAGVYKRVGKQGQEIWIQASYNPVLDESGETFKVIKFATDITEQRLKNADFEGQLSAIGKSQAVIEFDTQGNILAANDNFLSAVGYRREEIVGQHHRMFVTEDEANSAEYREFWLRLGEGKFDSGLYKRVGKNGREIWIQASYNPIFDLSGKPFKVVKYASDVTEQQMRRANYEGQMDAISRSQAVIEFEPSGKIITANENFLQALGYDLDEIVGQHHRLFMDPAEAAKPDYKAFWQKLARGEFVGGTYKRMARGGREIWIQATYNPIFDLNGKPYKVVKYATDVTEQQVQAANFKGQIDAINKVQAVIEFDLKGHILHANDLFLQTMGYTLEEVKGRHHRMFVKPGEADTPEYRDFWERLARGQGDMRRYCRLTKSGEEVWIQASYNSILDPEGRPIKVVKYAINVTEEELRSQSIREAVEQTKEVTARAEAGDLSRRVPLDDKRDDVRALCQGVNNVLDAMADIIGRIQTAAQTINQAATEIAQGNVELNGRTEQQAASLEETASSIEELTSTVKQNAENAQQANQLVIGASDVATKGGRVVGQVVSTMAEITESSNKIEDIISVIDGIAFQTNILALNAAVEAARAGEQGRGFAVVASEVRSLAQRSANAAKEIKELIGNSVGKIESGSELVEQAGKTMEEIVSSVKRVTDIMGEITAASQEQAAGINQVNHTVTQMDEATQQNAALVEQASASARALEEQANGLIQSVSRFRLSQDTAAGAPTKAPSAINPVQLEQAAARRMQNGSVHAH